MSDACLCRSVPTVDIFPTIVGYKGLQAPLAENGAEIRAEFTPQRGGDRSADRACQSTGKIRQA